MWTSGSAVQLDGIGAFTRRAWRLVDCTRRVSASIPSPPEAKLSGLRVLAACDPSGRASTHSPLALLLRNIRWLHKYSAGLWLRDVQAAKGHGEAYWKALGCSYCVRGNKSLDTFGLSQQNTCVL